MLDWSGQRVVVIGAARQGKALARYLVRHGAQVVLNDLRAAGEMAAAQAELSDLTLSWVLGGHPLSLLEGADLICLSAGVPLELPLVQEALQRDIPLSNDSQIFLQAAPCKVIGITGSAGKTTTTSLVGRIAAAHLAEKQPGSVQDARPPQAWVGGNIGTPLLSVLDEMAAGDLAVVELSSFQLELMTSSPQVAAVLNITPNHLDRHGSMAAYTVAKARLLAYQGAEDVAILNREDPGAWKLAGNVHGKLYTFGLRPAGRPAAPGTYLQGEAVILDTGEEQMTVLERDDILLRGEHNLQNVLASCAIAAAAGMAPQAMRLGVRDFSGVPHRLEFVRTWGGAAWYNDSIATAPERAMAAIRSFGEPIILLAGGRDKNLPWLEFADLVRQQVKKLILFGEAAGVIARAMGDFPFDKVTSLREAVSTAAAAVEPGDVVLLAPGGTSYDEFRDFEERGECFRQWVMEL